MRHSLRVGVVIVTLACAASGARGQQDRNAESWQTYGTSNGEWRSYAGDIAGTKYSPLDQVTADNFNDLRLVWEWTSVDTFVSKTMPGGGEWWAPVDTIVEALVEDTPNLYRTRHQPNPSGFQATPLMVGGILILQHAALAGRRRRRHDRGDPLGLQPQELRRRHDDDDGHLAVARRSILDRRPGGRANLLGNRQRLPGVRRC